MRFAIVLILTWFFVAGGNAQDRNLRLIDEIGTSNCEDLVGRLDSFFAEVTSDREYIGYVVVHGGLDPIENLIALRTVGNHVVFRNIAHGRIVVLSSNDKNQFRIKFWKSKNNARPRLKGDKIDPILPANFRRIGFADDIVEVEKFEGKQTYRVHSCEVCCLRSITDFRILSDFLENNSEFDAEFVVRAKSNLIYKKVAELIRRDLVQFVAVPTSRTKVIYGGNDRQLKDYDGDVATVSVSFVRR